MPSIPQSMQLPSISRVPSIPTPHRPLNMQSGSSLPMVDPMLQQSMGYPPPPPHAAYGYSMGPYDPAYGTSGAGWVMPMPTYSMGGPPLHLYQQTRGTSITGQMDLGGGAGGGGAAGGDGTGAGGGGPGGGMMDMMMGMHGPLHHLHLQQQQQQTLGAIPATSINTANAGSSAAPPSQSRSTSIPNPTPTSSTALPATTLNVRISPPPFNHSAGGPSAGPYLPYGARYPDPVSYHPLASSAAAAASASSASAGGHLDAATFHHNIRSLTSSTPRLLCLPSEDHSAQVLFVHSYQFSQILKRREQRRNDKRRRIKSKHKSRQAHAARRVRGSGGRFLTKEEKMAMNMQQGLKQMYAERTA